MVKWRVDYVPKKEKYELSDEIKAKIEAGRRIRQRDYDECHKLGIYDDILTDLEWMAFINECSQQVADSLRAVIKKKPRLDEMDSGVSGNLTPCK